jgi:hypothetical protein
MRLPALVRDEMCGTTTGTTAMVRLHRLRLSNCGTTTATGPRLWEVSEVQRRHTVDLESPRCDQRGNVPCEVETREHAVMDRLPPFLPTPDLGVGCDAVLEKNELATGLQDTCDIADRLHNSRNRTQGEGADDSVHGAVTQWDAFAWRIKEFDAQLRPATFPLCELEHFGVRLERVQRGDLGNVVVNEVGAGADADLENLPLSQRDNLPAKIEDGFWTSQPVNDVRVDTVLIESQTKSYSATSTAPFMRHKQ